MAPQTALAPPPTHQPVHGTCPRCDTEVLIVRGDIPLDPTPITPQYECPQCRQVANKGDTRLMKCWRCGDTRKVGQPLPAVGVAIDADGNARRFVRSGDMCGPDGRVRGFYGEAIHVLHVCGEA